jgi:pimeloyl-ACP methyl ester carboxylesterase
MEKVRNQLYCRFTRARLPALIAGPAEGDFSGFTQGRSGRVFADGLYLAITCAESFGEMDVDAAIDASQSTRFGAYRLERQRAACASCPGTARSQLMEQRKSNVPVLFIAGELDPVAPADWTRELAKYFPRGRVASIPHGGHMPDGLAASIPPR